MKTLTILFLLSIGTQFAFAITEDAGDCGLGGSTTLTKTLSASDRTVNSNASGQ